MKLIKLYLSYAGLQLIDLLMTWYFIVYVQAPGHAEANPLIVAAGLNLPTMAVIKLAVVLFVFAIARVCRPYIFKGRSLERWVLYVVIAEQGLVVFQNVLNMLAGL